MWQVLHMRTSLVLYPVSFLIIKRHWELSPAAEVYLHVIWFYLRRHLISSRVIFATHYFFFNFAICFPILVCIRATECLMIYSTKCLSYVACHLSTIEIAVQRKTNDSWTPFLLYLALINTYNLTCKCGSVDQSEGLLIPRSSFRFRLKPENSNSYGFELHRPSIKGTTLLLKVMNAIITTVRPFQYNLYITLWNWKLQNISSSHSTSTDIIIVWLLLLLLLHKKLSGSFAGSSICSGLRSTGQRIPTSNDTGSDSDDYCNTNENYRIFIHMHNNNRDTLIHIASIYEN